MFGRGKVKNIKKEKISKKVTIGDHETIITLDTAFTGEVDGKKEILDEVMIDKMLDEIADAIASNRTSYNTIPSEIIIKTNGSDAGSKSPAERKTADDKPVKNDKSAKSEIIESYDPRFTLDQVVLNPSVKEKINIAISATKNRAFLSENWGLAEHFGSGRAIILNFYGKPGTGKSMAAEAVAAALNKKVYHINYSELESKYVGETPKNIRKAFAKATEDDAILIFDEADSFLGKRLTSVTQSADYGVNITRSVLLMELEKYSGVVIFTTNLIKNYDEAFKRRILLSVYFEMPDRDSRRDIWKLHLGEKLPVAEGVTPDSLADRYDSLSGADIKDMVFYAALSALEKGADQVDLDSFDKANEVIRERYNDRSQEMKTKVIKTEQISKEQYLKETKGVEEDA
ncbi:MAG: ATP-binding protein [Lachnospiraceae bacterium]|uniref:ATP-binding protein n=1 Tax=Candidatus Weimeria bifida TaxID=2599074 RepID=A0A6N7IZ51_9FIRM|nr:ATP-binding protein [Candidatus Weimeria bifida]RRF95575.1 MAG: ATP-binding protein [Lachnospiraceae bacterium]